MSEIVVKVLEGVDETLARVAIAGLLRRLKVANETFGAVKPRKKSSKLVSEADDVWTV